MDAAVRETNEYRRRYRARVTSDAGVDGLRKTLLDQLDWVKLQVHGSASLVGRDETDPGTLDWHAAATISVWPEDKDLDEPWHSVPDLALSTTNHPDGARELSILEAEGLVIDLGQVEDVFEALDARSQDYEHFHPMFGDTSTLGFQDLAPELEDSLEAVGSCVVIIDRVRLAPAWRGLGGVGRLLIGRLLRWVCADPQVVAVHPFPIDLVENARRDSTLFEPELARVRRVWQSLGFRPFTENIWVMDPNLATHSDAVAQFAEELGM